MTHQRLKANSPNILPMTSLDWVSYGGAALGLLAILKCGLIIALFSGLLIYALTNALAPFINAKTHSKKARSIAVMVLLLVLLAVLSAAVLGAITFFKSEAGSWPVLLQKLLGVLEQSRQQLPEWLADYLPQGLDELKTSISDWITDHVADAKSLGQEVGHVLVQLILGTIIGSMLAFQDTQTAPSKKWSKPLSHALSQRVSNLALVFQKVVFAQVQISLINTVFTGIYLLAILPMLGVSLPLTKTLVAITFFAGLIPVVGNIMSNTAIVCVGLSVSLPVALGSLTFMVVIHKLEYFLNAKIIGAQIKAKAWEMLCAILLMETLFGLAGIVAAPVFYAYVKKELMDRQLV
jgi:predicted PurR-regulated permease PerM